MDVSARDIVMKLARALDVEDYDAAALLLDDACVYTGGPDGELRGRDAIIESYRAHGAQANQSSFDEIIFESEIVEAGHDRATIRYLDRLRLGEHWHDHRCAQHVTVGPHGRVVAIQHEDLPGEVESLQSFKATHRPSSS